MIRELYIYDQNGLRAIQNITNKSNKQIKEIISLLKELGDVKFEIKVTKMGG
jgi:hypothetical protein